MSLYIDINKDLSSFNLEVAMESKGGIIGFLGASGSGKSMTLKCIAGLEKADSGKIIINEKVLFDSENKINIKTKDRKVGFLFQNYALFPHMTIRDNIEIGLDKLRKIEKNKLSSTYIEKFGLNGLENRYHLRANMERELIEILKDYDGTVVFVTHDIAEAYRVCDKIIVFDGGKASEIREKDLLFKNPLSLAEAKITGCKNISKAKIINKDFIFAKEWNLKLKYQYRSNSINYIAIRSHNIKLFNNKKHNNDNVFNMIIENIVENPFDYTLYIKEVNCNNSNSSINFTISKEEMKFNVNDVIKVKFEENYLFTFE